MSPGDIILDCANELWKRSHARHARCTSHSFGNGAIHYLGCGVSGGYQAARHGPSMSPGGDKASYERIEPLLKKWAVPYRGEPCVAYMGKGGAGYVESSMIMSKGLTKLERHLVKTLVRTPPLDSVMLRVMR